MLYLDKSRATKSLKMSDLQHILVAIKNTEKDGGINSEVVNATN